MKYNVCHIGQFLKLSLWQEAKKLLDFQVNQMSHNKHYCTLSMFYYRKILHLTNEVGSEQYFHERVANGLFYALENEFICYDYVIPKSHLGLRNHKFFTYPMRILYYSIGLYLLKLSQDFIQNSQNNPCIQSYYGGNLSFNKNSLIVKHETTFYKKYYQSFKREIRKQIKNDSNNKLIIKLDIQNYFDNISIPILLENIDRCTKPSIREELKFDELTKEQIIFYYSYLSQNKDGIPQADNDIISNFIGYLYLSFGDLVIDDEISSYKDFINDHQIIRYVDDIFIVIDFYPHITQSKKESIAYSLSSIISDLLYFKLQLKLNTKTGLYWLNSKEDKERILKDLKKVSPQYYLNDDDNDETPENKLISIFHELQKLKNSLIDFSNCSDGTIEADILKEIYDKSVSHLIRKQENIEKLEEIFTDFNFDLVNNMPREIILIISQSNKVLQEFIHFLKSKDKISTRDVYLILNLLCQHDFKYNDLLYKIKNISSFEPIINIYETNSIQSEFPGYYKLSYKQIALISSHTSILEQIRLRIFNERINYYSVGLNHLLNEIHAVCMSFDKENKKNKYEADDVVHYLISKSVPSNIYISIRNLFDRRNRNTISHPSVEDKITWGVTKEEYIDYREAVGKCLHKILFT